MLGVIASLAALGVFAITALAVHDEAFQLDGNVLAASTTTDTSAGSTSRRSTGTSLFDAAGAEKALPDGLHRVGLRPGLRHERERLVQHVRQHHLRDGQQGHAADHAGLAVQRGQQRPQQERRDERVRGVLRGSGERRRDPVLRARAQRQHRHGQRGLLVPPGRHRELRVAGRHARRSPAITRTATCWSSPSSPTAAWSARSRSTAGTAARTARLNPDPVAERRRLPDHGRQRHRLRDRQHRHDHHAVADVEQAGRRRATACGSRSSSRAGSTSRTADLGGRCFNTFMARHALVDVADRDAVRLLARPARRVQVDDDDHAEAGRRHDQHHHCGRSRRRAQLAVKDSALVEVDGRRHVQRRPSRSSCCGARAAPGPDRHVHHRRHADRVREARDLQRRRPSSRTRRGSRRRTATAGGPCSRATTQSACPARATAARRVLHGHAAAADARHAGDGRAGRLRPADQRHGRR